MAEHRYVALLRGINVGGKNPIGMADLRRSFDEMGFSSVATYIQSGNVVFASKSTNKAALGKTIATGLSASFGYAPPVVLLSAAEFEKVVTQAPRGFGSKANQYRYDVLFVRPPLAAAEVLQQLSLKAGVDTAHAGDYALYFRRLASRATQSHLPRLVQNPVYQELTIRNWNTTTKLLEMLVP
jgi:uncharacterized protein (DUF1697 family)